MEADIEKYLKKDDIFHQVNTTFVTLNSSSEITEKLNRILDKLILAMKSQNALFEKTYKTIVYTGSYYKKTRVKTPDEFDLNLIIKLPLNEKDFKFLTDYRGYTKILTTWRNADALQNIQRASTLDPKARKDLDKVIDCNSYVNQNKFRAWIEGILSSVANNKNNEIFLDGIEDPIYIKRKSGPAFTLSFTCMAKPIDIDLVPVLAFPMSNPPPNFDGSKLDYVFPSDKYWYAVPKPLNDKYQNELYWRLSFFELEKDFLKESDNAKGMKPIIRHLKKFRDTQKFKNIASYYIETLCFHEESIFHVEPAKSFTSLFFTMLKKLRDAFENKYLNFYWTDEVNLLEKLNDDEKVHIKCRLNNIIKDIEKNIKEDKFAIAKYVLPEDELSKLRQLYDQPERNNINKLVKLISQLNQLKCLKCERFLRNAKVVCRNCQTDNNLFLNMFYTNSISTNSEAQNSASLNSDVSPPTPFSNIRETMISLTRMIDGCEQVYSLFN